MVTIKYKDKIKKLREDKDKKMILLRDKGQTLEQIGDYFGVRKETIRKRLIRLGY